MKAEKKLMAALPSYTAIRQCPVKNSSLLRERMRITACTDKRDCMYIKDLVDRLIPNAQAILYCNYMQYWQNPIKVYYDKV